MMDISTLQSSNYVTHSIFPSGDLPSIQEHYSDSVSHPEEAYLPYKWDTVVSSTMGSNDFFFIGNESQIRAEGKKRFASENRKRSSSMRAKGNKLTAREALELEEERLRKEIIQEYRIPPKSYDRLKRYIAPKDEFPPKHEWKAIGKGAFGGCVFG
eukprot:UN31013